METLIKIVGSLGLLLLGIAAVIGTFAFLVDKLKELYQNIVYNLELNARKELGTQIVRESYWYSEDEKTMIALKLLGENLTEHGRLTDMGNIRNAWRNRCTKAEGLEK